jgi:hypothetical protein
MAGSVWGGGEPGGYVRSWRATANGLEGVALGHCDALLCLDELSQVAARDAGEVAYMLAKGSGKSRSGRDGAARRAARWRVLFLSSGEIGLADKVAEDGRRKRPAAGQQVRIVEISADAGSGLGLFEQLHGFDSPDALARHVKISSGTHFGVAARAFLDGIAVISTASARPSVTTVRCSFRATFRSVQTRRFSGSHSGSRLSRRAGSWRRLPASCPGPQAKPSRPRHAASVIGSEPEEGRGGRGPGRFRSGAIVPARTRNGAVRAGLG